MRWIWILFSGLALAGCSGSSVLNTLASERGVTTTRDIAYGSGPRRMLDVYGPTDAQRAPVVVFFYGGSWQTGSKADYAFVARALAQSGIVVVVPDYRVYPEVKFAGFMHDGAAAVAWAKANAARYGGDPDRLVLMGHSAGAHIAALLTLDRRWLGREGIDPARALAGTVGLAGPYDFLPLTDPAIKALLGPPAKLADTQPINFVDGRNPPMFLGTDAADRVVEARNTESLAARIEAAGGPVEMRVYRGLTHATLIGVVSQPLGFASRVREDVTTFILSLRPTAARVSAR